MARAKPGRTGTQELPSGMLVVGVFLLFAPFGFLLSLLNDWAPGSGVITAIFSGTIAIGWMHAFQHRRFWLVVPLVLIPPPPLSWILIFKPLARLGVMDVGHTLEPFLQRLIHTSAAVACTGLGFFVVVRFIRGSETRSARWKAELDLGQKIHERLVKPVSVREAGVEIAGRSDASAEMGGDVLDLIREGDRTDLIVGDVSGHGVAAGVVMAMVKGAVRSRLMRDEPGAPSDLLEDLTRIVENADAPGMFVTMASLRFRRGSPRVEVALAGHNPVLWWRSVERRLDAVDNEGLPLGVSADERYATSAIEPAPGDWLVLYTDGLVEVNDAAGKQLGMRGFRAIVEEVVRGAGSADAVVAGVLERVRAHGPIADDQTIAVVRFTT
jgi:hypothetical protein